MRFCSRCGLALSGLAEWLAGGGIPARRTDAGQIPSDTARRRGIRRAKKLMFFSGVLFPVFLVISLAVDEGGPMFFPFALFFVALVLMLYARLFSDNTTGVSNPVVLTPGVQSSAIGSNPTRSSLPPANQAYIPPNQKVRTNELAQPASVTENTTRLLDD